MALSAIKLAEPAAPPTPLQRLLADRARLAGELAVLQASAARLQTEAAAGDALSAELDKLAESETTEMKGWASGGCHGPVPKGKAAERQAIAVKMAATNASSAAARSAGQDIDRQITEFSARLASLSQAIGEAALDTLQADFANLFDQHVEAAEKARALAARLHGLCSYLSNEGRRRIDKGEPEIGRAYLARAESLTTVKLASVGVTQSEIIAAANNWAARAVALSKG